MASTTKGEAIRVRLSPDQQKLVDAIQAKTGLLKPEILRQAIRFACPKFITGEEPIVAVAAGEKA